MNQQEWLARQFEDHRPHLRAVAYRMLGSLSDADDAVQDAWLRLSRTDTSEVENLRAWLTTIVARVALNMLRSRTTRREQPLDVHVPDPIIDPADGTDPEHEALLADSVGLALLVVLETLAPAERLAFVLHDMFAVPFQEIAPIVERSPDAARQLASRARRRIQGENPVPDADRDTQREVVDAFLAAVREGVEHRDQPCCASARRIVDAASAGDQHTGYRVSSRLEVTRRRTRRTGAGTGGSEAAKGSLGSIVGRGDVRDEIDGQRLWITLERVRR